MDFYGAKMTLSPFFTIEIYNIFTIFVILESFGEQLRSSVDSTFIMEYNCNQEFKIRLKFNTEAQDR